MSRAEFSSVLPQLAGFPIPSILRKALSRALGLNELAALYNKHRGQGLLPAVQQSLGIEVTVLDTERERIPKSGPCLLVANHPTGLLDGLILVNLIKSIRADIKVLGNAVLSRVPELAGLVIPVLLDESAGAKAGNAGAFRAALEHVSEGGALLIFPAAEVASFCLRSGAIREAQWGPGAGKLAYFAARSGLALNIVPVVLSARNSACFQAAGLIHPMLRTVLLAKEFLNKRGSRVSVRIGKAFPATRLLTKPREQWTQYLRWRWEVIASRTSELAAGSFPELTRIAPAVPRDLLMADIQALPEDAFLASNQEISVYLASAQQIPSVLREIGRLREETFRLVGEGTGRSVDLDGYDKTYLHLFAWNRNKSELVGAYRLAPVDEMIRKQGIRGIYTASLFRLNVKFFQDLGPTLELGRSFVRHEYQRSFAPLLLLWQGIGKFLVRHPRYTRLVGPVSISPRYSDASRELMMAFLERQSFESYPRLQIHGRRKPSRTPSPAISCGDLQELSELIAELEDQFSGIPVLLRHYLKLGGKVLGFNVDREFSNTVDGFICVDLTQTDPKLLDRYLGREEARQFLAAQKKEGYASSADISHRELAAS